MRRPNILLLYTDQQRWDALHCAGNPLIHTPHLDALAARGVRFEHAYVNSPVCQPSRMSMLSGRYPDSLGIATNGTPMPEDVPCIQHLLGPAGYHTANLGKLHFQNHSNRDHRLPHPAYGFRTLVLSDEPGCYDDAYIKWVEARDPALVDACRCDTPPAWAHGPAITGRPRDTNEPYAFDGPEDCTHTAFVADETIEFLRRHAAPAPGSSERPADPFFCIAGFYAPHCPVNPPQRFVDLYDPATMPLPARLPGQNYHGTSDEQWRKTIAYYYALVSHVDDQVGRILAALDDAGLTDDTLVIFTSDHGENLGDRGTVGKGNPEDSSARVPLIMAWPGGGLPAGEVCADIVEHIDLAPTFLDAAAVQQPPFMQGRTLLPALRHQPYAPAPREEAFSVHGEVGRPNWKSVRTRDHLYVYDVRGEGSERLYDCQADPDQLHNRVADPAYAEVLTDLRKRLMQRAFTAASPWRLKTGSY